MLGPCRPWGWPLRHGNAFTTGSHPGSSTLRGDTVGGDVREAADPSAHSRSRCVLVLDTQTLSIPILEARAPGVEQGLGEQLRLRGSELGLAQDARLMHASELLQLCHQVIAGSSGTGI